jgi:hypothetical protein
MVEPIDAAFEIFLGIQGSVAQLEPTLISEQDARLKVIDRVLVECLQWGLGDIQAEEQAGTGFVDYKLSIDGRARLVVEAKRDSRPLGLSGLTSGRAYKLNGPVFKTEAAREGIEQAVRYCAHKGAELACVTNGREWIVFRGSRLCDGSDTLAGSAFGFETLAAVRDQFRLFYNLLARPSVAQLNFRAHFQEAEGRPIRTELFRKPIRAPESAKLVEADKLSHDLDKIMLSFFRNLTGDNDPDLIAKCFVTSRESEAADKSLLRISESLAERMKDLDTQSGDELVQAIRRVHTTRRHEFILVVGTKGSGKSTFVERFFKFVLPRDLVRAIVPIRVDLAESNGDEAQVAQWLERRVLETAEREVFKGAPSFEELEGMFFDEYQRWRSGTLRPLYETNRDQFKVEFGRHIETRREERPHDYICGMMRHVVNNRRRVPCLVFDNADHFTIEFQERVFQFARSIYEQQLCVVLLPITDKTSWQLSRQGAIQSFYCETLYLPTPPARVVLEKRIGYLSEKLAGEKAAPGTGYFLGRGIELAISDLREFAACLQAIFVQTGAVSEWIGNLSNCDVRRGLDLARLVATSPHLRPRELLKAFVEKTAVFVPPRLVRKAIVRGKYDIYPIGKHKFVQNIFYLTAEVDTSPLLGVRILQLLTDAQHEEEDGRTTFISVDRVIEYLVAMDLAERPVALWLESLLRTGLCLCYDPTTVKLLPGSLVEISPAGKQHLAWALRDLVYMESMMLVTPILVRPVYEELRALCDRTTPDEARTFFVQYLIGQDEALCVVPAHDSYGSQADLRKRLERAHSNRPVRPDDADGAADA